MSAITTSIGAIRTRCVSQCEDLYLSEVQAPNRERWNVYHINSRMQRFSHTHQHTPLGYLSRLGPSTSVFGSVVESTMSQT